MAKLERADRIDHVKNTIDAINILLGKLDSIGCRLGYLWFTFITNKNTNAGHVVQFPAIEFKSKFNQLVDCAIDLDFEELYIAIHLEREGVEDDFCISITNRVFFETPDITIFMNNKKLCLLVTHDEFEQANSGVPMHALPVYETSYVGFVADIPYLIHPHIQRPEVSVSQSTYSGNVVSSPSDSLLGLARSIK